MEGGQKTCHDDHPDHYVSEVSYHHALVSWHFVCHLVQFSLLTEIQFGGKIKEISGLDTDLFWTVTKFIKEVTCNNRHDDNDIGNN